MELNLKKGMSLNLTKENEGLEEIQIGLGWKTEKDLDAFAYLINENNNIQHIVYFGNQKEKGIFLNGDDLVGGGDGDNEIITVNLPKLSKHINKIVFGANIYNAKPARTTTRGFFNKQEVVLEGDNFGQISNAYIHVVDSRNNKELCKYSLTEDGKNFNAFELAILEKIDSHWQFRAIGKGMNGSITKLSNEIEY